MTKERLSQAQRLLNELTYWQKVKTEWQLVNKTGLFDDLYLTSDRTEVEVPTSMQPALKQQIVDAVIKEAERQIIRLQEEFDRC